MNKFAALALALALVGGAASNMSASAAGGNAAKGKAMFASQCAMCHGATGKGDGAVGKTLKPAPRNFTTGTFKYGSSDAQIAALIKKGKAPMPGYATLSDQQLKDLVAYIRSLKKK
ncbi:MAG: cytochrome c [Candidatus Sericytochromatia bacterium]|nr:cytochrome c [Candidatus Sericytochromatia bacterium]